MLPSVPEAILILTLASWQDILSAQRVRIVSLPSYLQLVFHIFLLS